MVEVRRISPGEGELLRSMRIAALADAPGEATTTVSRAMAREAWQWEEAAEVNASGPTQATFFATSPDEPLRPVGMVGAYANQDGTVNVVGLWSAPGFRDVGVADALLLATAGWARVAGCRLLRIWVVERNEHGRRYYERQGFEASGATMPYEPDPRLHQIEMVLIL